MLLLLLLLRNGCCEKMFVMEYDSAYENRSRPVRTLRRVELQGWMPLVGLGAAWSRHPCTF